MQATTLPYPLAALPTVANGKLHAPTNLGHLQVIDGTTLWVESETSAYTDAHNNTATNLNWYQTQTPLVYESGVLGVSTSPNSTGSTLL